MFCIQPASYHLVETSLSLLEVKVVPGETCVTFPIEADRTLSSHSTHGSTVEKYFLNGENCLEMFVKIELWAGCRFGFGFDGNLRTPLVQFA